MTDTKPTPGWATIVLADEEAAALGPTIPPLRPVLAFPSVEARDAAADVLSLGRLGGAVLAARAERDAALEMLDRIAQIDGVEFDPRCEESIADGVHGLSDHAVEMERERDAARAERDAALDRVRELERERDEARDNLAEASRIWDGPETGDWLDGVSKEAAHQVARWGVAHDDGKEPGEFFWTLGYLANKALAAVLAGDAEKAKHHTISSGALLLNWHARIEGHAAQFRPGIDPARALLPKETDDGE